MGSYSRNFYVECETKQLVLNECGPSKCTPFLLMFERELIHFVH